MGALTAEHAGEALTVQRAAYVTEAQRYSAPDIPPLTETLDELRAEIEASSVLAFGAWLGPRLVGAVRGRLDGDRMEVARFVVAPDMQGRGVGRALLDAIHDAVPATVRTLWLITGADSVQNLRMYERAGYRRVADRKDSVGVAITLLEKQLGH
ncbi:GNAT family N-acetyltransferase [Solihabitans fulvus]|uniref:GNAT family N-acetyltransferase n=1 Tax=Solihabitans fulvus TaxID=1892852 RepID=A0A5B2XFV1_9PSEU|nr:GNAT family N-acetyltransferase [Solihabitans fulvus]